MVNITFGDDPFIGLCCGFYSAVHPINAEMHNKLYEKAKPVTVGNNVWFRVHCAVLPGVTIGSNVGIGAGSVVSKNISDGVVAFGNPCTDRREI